MKNMKFFLLGIGVLFLASCYDEQSPELSQNQSEDKVTLYTEDSKEDTVKQLNNYIDKNGLRQGYWKISASMMRDENMNYAPDAIVREGIYVDSKEEGVWLEYFPNGNLKRKVSYRRGMEVK